MEFASFFSGKEVDKNKKKKRGKEEKRVKMLFYAD